MIIAIAGIKRSGSTVQFNLVRIALEMAGYTVNICGHHYTPRAVPEGEVDLVKKHPFDKKLAEAADHIFLTDRNDEEIIESLTRFNGKAPYEGRIDDMREHLDKWKEYTNARYIFPYKLWQSDERLYSMGICYALKLNIDYNEVLGRFHQIEPPESGQDSKTLMFSNHITSK